MSEITPLDTLLAIKAISLAPSLRDSDRRVGIALIEHFNRRTGRCDPSHARLARLLDLTPRTVVRSVKRLEAAGLFAKVRHGGYSNRNRYLPDWDRFDEWNEHWQRRFKLNTLEQVTSGDDGHRQDGHLPTDSGVTQTYFTNRSTRTVVRNTSTRGVEERPRQRQREAAETAAERRWDKALRERYASDPGLYATIVTDITEEIRHGATEAEFQSTGAGITFIIDRLAIGPGQASATPNPSEAEDDSLG